LGELQHFPTPLAEFKGSTSREREGRKGKGRGEKGGVRKGVEGSPGSSDFPPDVGC